MIEILVALVILAIGLLGMATLMINSMQTNQSASMRSAATLAAYDLAERMRSNMDEEVLKEGTYKVTTAEPVSGLTGGITDPAAQCPGTCTGKDLAEHDIRVWAYALEKSVPGSKVIIKPEDPIPVTIDGAIQNQYRLWCIGILWEDTGGANVNSGDTACGASNSEKWAFYEFKVLL